MDLEVREQFEREIRNDGRYPPEAFEFLLCGLERAAERKYGVRSDRSRHVTGQELAEALRELAIERWGFLAREVLRRWNVHRTRDFGEMVYLMIRIGSMGKQDSDDIADFDDVYDFRCAFDHYQIPLSCDASEDVEA